MGNNYRINLACSQGYVNIDMRTGLEFDKSMAIKAMQKEVD